jgi:hypothetical protein
MNKSSHLAAKHHRRFPLIQQPITNRIRIMKAEMVIDLNSKAVLLATQSGYMKAAYKYLSEIGVQNMSRLSFYFDPTYQSFTFHTQHFL